MTELVNVIVLHGAPAAGKDTVTEALAAADNRIQLYRPLRTGPSSNRYRQVEVAQLASLDVVWQFGRYGRTYAIDRQPILDQIAAGGVPVVHTGDRATYAAVRAAFPCLGVLLCADRDTTSQRLASRGDDDVADRLEAWDDFMKDLEGAPPAAFDLTIKTTDLPPTRAARRILASLGCAGD